MRLRDLTLFVGIFGCLLVIEVALEIRAHGRGFDTIGADVLGQILGDEAQSDVTPTPEYPFNGDRLTQAEVVASSPVVWVSSSSFALGGELSFPAAMQRELVSQGWIRARVLAEAVPGRTATGNIERLTEFGPRYQPDVVLMYQLTNDLHDLSSIEAADGDLRLADAPSRDQERPGALVRLYERTVIFAQLTANLTPWFTQHRPSPEALSAAADSVFEARMRSFVTTARTIGAVPVLATLATSHRRESLPRDRRFWMLRWNPSLSPEAYARTAERWNDIIRAVGRELEVVVVDIDAQFGGRSEYFEDLVHFTEEGRELVGQELGTAIAALLEAEPAER